VTRVVAMTHFPDGAGGDAELVVAGAGLAAPVSPAISFAAAAAAPLAAGTARVVLARLVLAAGSRLLVLGGTARHTPPHPRHGTAHPAQTPGQP